MRTWQLQDAKARFSEVIRNAATKGPQGITVRGKPTVVIISQSEFDSFQKTKPSFMQFLRHSPLFGTDIDFARDKSMTRDVDDL